MKKMVLLAVGVVVLTIGVRTQEVRADEHYDVFVETLSDDSDIVANCVTPTQDGGFVVTGYTGSGGTGKYLFLGKFDSEGNPAWIEVCGPANAEGRCVVETQDGDFVAVGFREHEETERDWLLKKYSSSGGHLWTRTWEGERSEEAHEVIEASDGTLWVAGFTNSFTPGPSYRNEVVLAKIAADGNSFDGVRAGNPGLSRDYYGYALAEVFDTGGICVAGHVTGPSFDDILLVKFDDTPDFLWAYRIGDSKSEKAMAIVRTSDACLALAGEWSWWDGLYMNYGGFLLKTDPLAIVDWGRSAGGYYGHTKTVQSVVETADEGLVVTGGYDHEVTSYKVLLAKWNLDGDQLWTRGFGDFWAPVGYSAVEDADRSLLVAGTTNKNGGGDALLARACCTGSTCLDPVEGPSFPAWSPSQDEIGPLDTAFTASLTFHLYSCPSDPDVIPVCSSTTYTVCPYGLADFVLIQDAIDAASNGDIIELCDGTFTGVGNRDLDFLGKCLTVRSQSGNRDACIIDCQGLGRGFYFHTDEGCHSIVSGITIANGTADNGGGIYCEDASPMITNCGIVDCYADDFGGGIYCGVNASPTITDCDIVDCYAYDFGGGIYCGDGSSTITDCDIQDCYTDNAGGGIYSSWGSPTISNSKIAGCGWAGDGGIYCDSDWPTITGCTITGNDGDGISFSFSDPVISHCTLSGNGSYGISFYHSDSTIEHSILWGNCGEEIWQYGSSISCDCCDVQGGGCYGNDNIDEDPLFCDPEPCENAPTTEGDYYLRPGSPCADNDPCGQIGALGVGCECTYVVCPDGSGDFETIQDAIDAAEDGYVICLCDATFSDTGNVNLDFQGKAITVKSENDDPEACIIDCGPGIGILHRGFYFHSGEGPDSVVEGVGIINGWANVLPAPAGGAILCANGSSPTIRNCMIVGNSMGDGGGIACTENSSPMITGCVISGNRAGNDGGGIYTDTDSSPDVMSCTVSGNWADNHGGGIFGGCVPQYTIIWGNYADGGGEDGDEWYGDGAGSVVDCCNDIDMSGLGGFGTKMMNCGMVDIDADPLFCDPEDCENAPTTAGDYYLDKDSPCAPAKQPECGLIGAFDVADPECEADCNSNGINDKWDIAGGASEDENANGTPDECECYCRDANCDGSIDSLDLGVVKNPANWLLPVPPANPQADVNRDGVVDALDLGAIKDTVYWMTNPHPGGCICSQYTGVYEADCLSE